MTQTSNTTKCGGLRRAFDYTYNTNLVTDEERAKYPMVLGRLANLADKSATLIQSWADMATNAGWSVTI